MKSLSDIVWTFIETERSLKVRGPFRSFYFNQGQSKQRFIVSCIVIMVVYYNKTFWNLLIRCNEHWGVNRNRQKLATRSPSSIGDHGKQTGHVISLENFQITSRTDNSFDLLIHESLLIQGDRPGLNFQQSSIPLVLF